MPLVPGSRLDAYELVRPLGAGGMGEVWLATEERLGRKVALKLLPADLTSDASRIERFEQEARAASALSHPNVCTIHALAQTGDGQHYIAMEYVEGQTLRDRVLVGSRLTIRESLDIAIQIAQALSAAHAQGIVHRDMKPENVMLRPDGFVKVLDFGLAKLVPARNGFEAEQTRATLLTDAGTVVGTVAYMSPEQARGQEVDARSDVWALGCILYEMVAGRSPFAAPNSSDVLAAILDKEPAPIARFEPDVPAELQRIVTKALRKDRAQRYQTTQDLLLDLQALRDDLHIASSSGRVSAVTANAGRTGTRRRYPATRRRKYLLLVGLLGIAGAIAGAAWWRDRGSTQPTRNVGAMVPRNLTRLTVGAGLQTDATFSPDGRFFAYASDRAGNFDIWVQPVAGGDPVRITRSSADDTQPDWSPDGGTIAFHSERDGGGIYVVAALGGTERRLVAGGQQPAWSPDGRHLLFLKGVEVPGAGPPMQYSVYNVADDQETPLWPGWFVFDAAWHPDGRITAIGLDRSQNPRAFEPEFLTGGVDGTAIARTALPAECPDAIRQAFPNGVGRLSWSPKGTQLFMQVTAGEIESVWRLSVDPQTLAATQCERLTMGAERQSGLSLSRDGTRLAYTAQSDATRLWRVRLDGDTKREAPTPLTDEEGEVATYDVSLDGKRIALEMRHRGTDQTELQVLDVSTKSTSTLGGDGVWRRQPRWSPDAQRVAYAHVRERTSGREVSLAVWDTTSPEQIVGHPPGPGSLTPFDWTADGRFVLVSQTGRTPAIELWPAAAHPPATTPARQLISEADSFIWQERYSPDGRWLSFVNVPTLPGAHQRCKSRLSPIRAVDWRRIAPSFAWTDKPRWSPDGRRLYFLARDGGVFNVWVVPFDASRGEASGAPTQVTRFYPPELTLSPDVDKVELGVTADSLILPLKHVAGSIWMLDNVDK